LISQSRGLGDVYKRQAPCVCFDSELGLVLQAVTRKTG
jgi:hypothetical protein